ncbi:MAG: VWA domain-containing protein, partial [Acidobacteriota bacterium]
MNRFGKAFLLLVLAAIAAAGQRPAVTPTPDTDVVRISTTLIQIDATVTDARGKVVTDLKPGDFEIFENGKLQKITSFSFVSNAKTTGIAEPKAAAIPGIPPPPITLRPEQVRRTIALVVDDITLSFESVYYVRRALKKFVDEQMQPGDLVAVIRTTGGMGSLQQFTSDKRQLYAAIEKIRWNPRGTNLGAFTPIEGPVDLNSDAFEAPDSGPGERSDEAIAKEYEQYRKDVFAVGTLGALNYVLRGMHELPGRKSVLMMSDGFKLTSDDASGTQEASNAF